MSTRRKRGKGRRKRPREEDISRDSMTAPSQRQSFPASTYGHSAGSSFPEIGYDQSQQATFTQFGAPSTASRRDQIQSPVPYASLRKVAIPALKPPSSAEASAKGGKKERTSHACDNCRKAKAGCTGEQPCQRCQNAHVPCIYGDGKRDKDKKWVLSLRLK